MNELATAVFAAQSGAHLVDVPRSARFAAFLREFDEGSYLLDLTRRGFRWAPRGDRGFPARLGAIHDPPPGLFVRGDGPLGLLDQPSVAVVGARACSAYGSAVAAARS
jgi:predicted Rossmann fold nucleotide-binding protein DprA/Smf involved in DNA uptake